MGWRAVCHCLPAVVRAGVWIVILLLLFGRKDLRKETSVADQNNKEKGGKTRWV